MKPKTMILMILAVTCGLGASFMTSRLLAERQSGDDDKEKVNVLVAKKNLDMGTTVKNPHELFETKAFVKGEEPKDAILVGENQLEEVFGQLKSRAFKNPRRTGDIISMEDMLDSKGSGIQGSLPEGHRAIGLRVNMEAIAGGFAALPHSRVDIISTVRRGDDRNSFSQVLLENILVLAADAITIRAENNQAMPANVVTVALTPEQVLKVNIAKELGTLGLALRRFGDSKNSDVGKVTVQDILTRGTAPRTDDGDEDESQATGGIGATLPKIGAKKPGPVEVAVAPAKKSNLVHSLVIIEGDKERRTDYAIDRETGEVIRPDVIRSEVQETPTAGPAPAISTPAPRTGTTGSGTGTTGGGWSGGN